MTSAGQGSLGGGRSVAAGTPGAPSGPTARFAWKSEIAFLIFAWFSGLRASWTTFAAIPDAMSFLSMPAMPASLYGLRSPCPDNRWLNRAVPRPGRSGQVRHQPVEERHLSPGQRSARFGDR